MGPHFWESLLPKPISDGKFLSKNTLKFCILDWIQAYWISSWICPCQLSQLSFPHVRVSGENCLMLTHEGFPDVPWTKKTLDLVPSKCDASKSYICELNMYIGGE